MATYFMFGKYSLDAMRVVSAKRTADAIALIKQYGGELKSGYALLGDIDLVLIVDLPDTEHAMKTSAVLNQMLGISFTTAPAVCMEDFDQLLA